MHLIDYSELMVELILKKSSELIECELSQDENSVKFCFFLMSLLYS